MVTRTVIILSPHFKNILQLPGHGDHLVIWRVVLVAVCEDEPDVSGELRSGAILSRLHLGLDGAQVHGRLDDLPVVGQVGQIGVHRLVEGPRVRVVLLGEELL